MAKAAVIVVCAAVALWIIAYTIVTLWRERRRVRCCRNCVFACKAKTMRGVYVCKLDDAPPYTLHRPNERCAGYSNRYDCKRDLIRFGEMYCKGLK